HGDTEKIELKSNSKNLLTTEDTEERRKKRAQEPFNFGTFGNLSRLAVDSGHVGSSSSLLPTEQGPASVWNLSGWLLFARRSSLLPPRGRRRRARLISRIRD